MSIARYSRADAPQSAMLVPREALDGEASTRSIADAPKEVADMPRRLHAGRVECLMKFRINAGPSQHVRGAEGARARARSQGEHEPRVRGLIRTPRSPGEVRAELAHLEKHELEQLAVVRPHTVTV
jgi:hypothetical protein